MAARDTLGPMVAIVTDGEFDAKSTVDASGPADYYWRTPATVAASHQ